MTMPKVQRACGVNTKTARTIKPCRNREQQSRGRQPKAVGEQPANVVAEGVELSRQGVVAELLIEEHVDEPASDLGAGQIDISRCAREARHDPADRLHVFGRSDVIAIPRRRPSF